MNIEQKRTRSVRRVRSAGNITNRSQVDEICPFVPLKPATENRTPFLFTPLARAMSEKVATNSHETNAEKLRRSSLALRGKRCYHLFLCSVAPTAPAAQPAVSLATVYGCKGCAAGLVFMCVSRASLACCDCYPQRLFGKLGAATAVSGFRAKELDPYHRRCRTVHQRVEATTPDDPRVANAKKYRRARSCPTEKGREGGPLEAKHGHSLRF